MLGVMHRLPEPRYFLIVGLMMVSAAAWGLLLPHPHANAYWLFEGTFGLIFTIKGLFGAGKKPHA